jgi:transposase
LPQGAAPPRDHAQDRPARRRSQAWLVGYRRLQVRYERRAELLLGFLYLACALICLKALNQSKG